MFPQDRQCIRFHRRILVKVSFHVSKAYARPYVRQDAKQELPKEVLPKVSRCYSEERSYPM